MSIDVSTMTTRALAALVREGIDELRNRGRSLAIEGDTDAHATALRTLERLTSSADTVELLARAQAAND